MDIQNARFEKEVRAMIDEKIQVEYKGNIAAFARDHKFNRSYITSIVQDGKSISAKAAATVGMEPLKIFVYKMCSVCESAFPGPEDGDTCEGCGEVERDDIATMEGQNR